MRHDAEMFTWLEEAGHRASDPKTLRHIEVKKMLLLLLMLLLVRLLIFVVMVTIISVNPEPSQHLQVDVVCEEFMYVDWLGVI